MKATDLMAARYKNDTFQAKNGYLRKEQKVLPSFQYHMNQEPLTDKQLELYLIQHKQMVEFLSRKGLVEEYNQLQQKKAIEKGEFVDWFKKWH